MASRFGHSRADENVRMSARGGAVARSGRPKRLL